MSKLFRAAFFAAILVPIGRPIHAQKLEPPFDRITSDFGPRNVTDGSFFHPGIDYNPISASGDTSGTPIPAVDTGFIAGRLFDGREGIRQDSSLRWTLDVDSLSDGSFQYVHIFFDWDDPSPTHCLISGKFELCELIDANEQSIPFVIRYRDATRQLIDAIFIDQDHSGIEARPGYIAQAAVLMREEIAPIGNSGTKNAHCHLGFNRGRNNPLFRVLNRSDVRPTVTISAPTEGGSLANQNPAAIPLKAQVHSSEALNLDKVDFFIYKNGDSNLPLHVGSAGLPTFGYGGRPGDSRTGTATIKSNGTNLGVKPIGNDPGEDLFVFLADFTKINNGNPLPNGKHTLVVRCKDVNNNPGCLNSDGTETSVTFSFNEGTIRFGSTFENVPRDISADWNYSDPFYYAYDYGDTNTLASAPWLNMGTVRLAAEAPETMDVYDPTQSLLLHIDGDGIETASTTISGLPDAAGYQLLLDKGTEYEQALYFNKDASSPLVDIGNVTMSDDGAGNYTYTVTGNVSQAVSGVGGVCLAQTGICAAVAPDSGGAMPHTVAFTLTRDFFCGTQDVAAISVAGVTGIGQVFGTCELTVDADGNPAWGRPLRVDWTHAGGGSPPPASPMNVALAYGNAYVAVADVQPPQTLGIVDPPVTLPTSYYTLTDGEGWSVRVGGSHRGEATFDLPYAAQAIRGGRPLGAYADQARLLKVDAGGAADVTRMLSGGRTTARGYVTGDGLYTLAVSSRVAGLLLDFVPPVTSLSFQEGAGVTRPDGVVLVSPGTKLGFNVLDPPAGGWASGLAGVNYLLDAPFTDTTTTPGIPWDYAPVPLAAGNHQLVIYSSDSAGNLESPRRIEVDAVAGFSTNGTSPNGVALTARSGSTLELSWIPAGDPPGTIYSVSAATSCAGPAQAYGFQAASATFPGLAPSADYAVTVCNAGSGACAAPVVARTGAGVREPAPAPAPLFCGGSRITRRAAAVDQAGMVWQTETSTSGVALTRRAADGTIAASLALPGAPDAEDWRLGFDGDGNLQVLVAGSGTSRMYTVSPQGSLLSSAGHPPLGGKPGGIDSDGNALWAAGTADGSAVLWRADAANLTMRTLSPAATAQAVLADGSGSVWVGGAASEAVLWRFDAATGNAVRYDWNNNLGGRGSAAQSLLEDTGGNIWLAGWTRTASGQAAALWKFDGASLALVAASTGTTAERGISVDMDAAGRLWVAGGEQITASGDEQLSLWSYAGEGSVLALSGRWATPPASAGDIALAIGGGNASALAARVDTLYGVQKQSLGLGAISGTLHYSAGFSGGNVYFFASPTPDFQDPLPVGPFPAPGAGSDSAFALDGLPMPATYYLAAIYDVTGSMDAGGPVGGAGNPVAIALTAPVFLRTAAASVPTMNLSLDNQPPAISIRAPVDGSTITANQFAIAGTAADGSGIIDLSFALSDLGTGTWWDGNSGSFMAASGPVWNTAARSGALNGPSWSGTAAAVSPGHRYAVYAQAFDLSGNVAVATATASIAAPPAAATGDAIAFARGSGGFWAVVQDGSAQSLRRFDSAGILVASTALPQPLDASMAAIAITPSGEAWAVGSASSSLRAWKFSAEGLAVLAAAETSGADGVGGAAVDSSGDLWVTGAVQAGAGTALALWRFSSEGVIRDGYPKAFQRAAGTSDSGVRLRIDGSGGVWAVGRSSDPTTGSGGLMVWKFTAQGSSSAAAYWPGAAGALALEAASGGGMWVTASKSYLACAASDLALLRLGADASILSTSLWHGAAGTAAPKGLALGPGGEPWVVGAADGVPAVWRFDPAGQAASGYPRTDAPGFHDGLISVDAAGTAWTVRGATPEVFAGTVAVAGASGPSPCSLVGTAHVSGVIDYAAGFVAGSTVTVAYSTDAFRSRAQTAVVAAGGTSVPFSLALQAPATYWIMAALGDGAAVSSSTPFGVYAGLAGLGTTGETVVTEAEFALHVDTVPPTTTLSSIVSGSTLTALSLIQGAAADDIATDGTVDVAVEDALAGLWWDGDSRRWIASGAPVYRRVPGGAMGRTARWSYDATATGVSGAFVDGRTYAVLARALDIAGNRSAVPASATFLWRGTGDFLPPRTRLDVGSPNFSSGTVYASAATTFSFTATDDSSRVGDGVGLGVARTLYSLDGGTEAVFAAPFSVIGQGVHTLVYHSIDLGGHVENQATATIAVDFAPPMTSLQILGTAGTDAQGGLLISSRTLVALSASDPQSAGVASGVASTFYILDADPRSLGCEGVALDTSAARGSCANAAYADPFTLSIGTHSVYFLSEDRVGNREPVRIASVTVLGDVQPPRTSLVDESVTLSSGVAYSGSTYLALSAVDDLANTGDGAGLGVAATFVSHDGGPSVLYPGYLDLGSEGAHTLSFYSVDAAGHVETVQATAVSVDTTPPQTSLAPLGASTLDASGAVLVSSGVAWSLTGNDPLSGGTASGLSATYYVVDADPFSPECEAVPVDPTAPSGTCANEAYGGPFVLAVGSHTIRFFSEDLVGNQEAVHALSVVVLLPTLPSPYTLAPTTGPIGIPFTLTGPGGFGSYQGANTRVLFGTQAAPLSIWNDTNITGTVPGLSTGTYPVTVAIGTNSYSLWTFQVQLPSAASMNVSSGPIGMPFTITGTQFGPYAGTLTRVLIGGATAPLSVWDDTTISGTVPGALSTGTYTVQVQRATSDGGLMSLSPFSFTVVGMSPTGFSPTSAPIGAPFTVTGSGFGPYNGSLTQFLFDGKAAPLSVWNDAQITGTVPKLSSGTHAVWISRGTSDGGLTTSDTAYFTVTVPSISSAVPTSGPIGNGFTLTGTSFGPYNGAYTQVLMGGATCALSVWNDTQITGTVPGTLLPGSYPLLAERLTSDGGLVTSNTVYFQVTAPFGASLPVSYGPIGIPFTITGSGFGAYNGASTLVLIGNKTAPLSVWNDTTITGTIPGLSTGTYGVLVERISGNSVSSAAVAGFTVLPLSPTGVSASSGPIGVPFTITGSAFGPYAGSLTRVLFDGVAAALSVWNDVRITGTVPALSTGTHTLWIERASSDGGLQSSDTAYFTVVAPSPSSLAPTSGPIGVPFTITGSGFGPYNGSYTRLMVGGVAAPLSVWNDTTISGRIPAMAAGSQPMWIERQVGSSIQSSDTAYFTITVPVVNTMSVSSGPIGAPFTLTGTSFGPYNGANTRVLIGGATAPLSVWNDTTITGTIPGALPPGVYDLTVAITASGGSVQTSSQAFTVLQPVILDMSPSYGSAGTGVQLTGYGFGPYSGSATKVLLGTTSVALSVWNDTRIVWTVPSGVPDGAYALTVVRSPSGGTIASSSMTFSVGTGGVGGASLALKTATPLASEPAWHFEGSLFLSTDTGGKIDSPSKAAVTVPGGALSTATVVTMARDRSTFTTARAAALNDSKLGAGGEAVSFGPEGTRFAVPVTIELPYDPDLVPPGKLGELAIHYFDPGAKTWTPLVTSVDPLRHVLSAQTSHFSLYQPLGHGIGVLAANAAFQLNAAYAFPNPVHSGAVTIRVQPGLADTVSVRVYDVGGRKVHESSDFSLNPSLDDGNGLGAQYTYDHAWDVSGVGSGVYTFVITAKKAGQADLHKTGRLGVSK